MKRRLAVSVLTAAALAIALAAGPARAGNDTNTLTVTANVVGTCEIDPATLAFGNYDPLADRDAQGTITVRCTSGTNYSIGLGGTNADRAMSGPNGDTLNFELYTDADRIEAWENATAVSGTATTAAGGLTVYTETVYGRIPAGQQVSTGGYNGTLAMTVNF
jgi:spore coat protein U-like protein